MRTHWWHLRIMRASTLEDLLHEARQEGARRQREANVIRADLIPKGLSLSWDGKFTGTPQEPGSHHFTLQTREPITGGVLGGQRR